MTLQSQAPQGISANVEMVESSGNMTLADTNEVEELVEFSSVDLAEEIYGSQMNPCFYQANLQTLQTVD